MASLPVACVILLTLAINNWLCSYSHADLEEAVLYAQDRGIRTYNLIGRKQLVSTRRIRSLAEALTRHCAGIIPEWDVPGHSSFAKGVPELTIAVCGGVLDPTKNATYSFLRSFLEEMGSVSDGHPWDCHTDTAHL